MRCFYRLTEISFPKRSHVTPNNTVCHWWAAKETWPLYSPADDSIVNPSDEQSYGIVPTEAHGYEHHVAVVFLVPFRSTEWEQHKPNLKRDEIKERLDCFFFVVKQCLSMDTWMLHECLMPHKCVQRIVMSWVDVTQFKSLKYLVSINSIHSRPIHKSTLILSTLVSPWTSIHPFFSFSVENWLSLEVF